jgi:hypothetical protein
MIDDLAPRKGHFSSSPWQRHGKTVPQKEYALKGHPDLPGPFQFARNHEAPFQGLLFLLRTIPMALPWAASGVPLPGASDFARVRARFLRNARRLVQGFPSVDYPEK